MTLVEVLNTKKRFKRPSYKKYLYVTDTGEIKWVGNDSEGTVGFHSNALLATDWEVENESTNKDPKYIQQILLDSCPALTEEEIREITKQIEGYYEH